MPSGRKSKKTKSCCPSARIKTLLTNRQDGFLDERFLKLKLNFFLEKKGCSQILYDASGGILNFKIVLRFFIDAYVFSKMHIVDTIINKKHFNQFIIKLFVFRKSISFEEFIPVANFLNYL